MKNDCCCGVAYLIMYLSKHLSFRGHFSHKKKLKSNVFEFFQYFPISVRAHHNEEFQMKPAHHLLSMTVRVNVALKHS